MRHSPYTVQLLEAKAFMEQHDDFLVISHVHPDGDAISSTCAMGWMLRSLGKKFVMANENRIPEKFLFLPGCDHIVKWDESAPYGLFSSIISLDCADYTRIGQVSTWLRDGAQLLNIDHHATNDGYGDVQLIAPEAAATGEILYDLAETLGILWDADIASCVYTGLLTDTGGFRYANTSAKVMEIASKMLNYGCNAAKIADDLLEKMTFSQIELTKRTLNSLMFSANRQIAWVSVTVSDMKETGAHHEDLEGLVNYPRNVDGVEVGILFKELEQSRVKVSFRSAGRADVAVLAKSLGGGGHARAAGVTIEGTLAQVIPPIIRKVESELR